MGKFFSYCHYLEEKLLKIEVRMKQKGSLGCYIPMHNQHTQGKGENRYYTTKQYPMTSSQKPREKSWITHQTNRPPNKQSQTKREKPVYTPKQTKEEEIGSLPEKEFRIIIVKMIQNLKNKRELQINSLETRIGNMQEMFNKDLEEI